MKMVAMCAFVIALLKANIGLASIGLVMNRSVAPPNLSRHNFTILHVKLLRSLQAIDIDIAAKFRRSLKIESVPVKDNTHDVKLRSSILENRLDLVSCELPVKLCLSDKASISMEYSRVRCVARNRVHLERDILKGEGEYFYRRNIADLISGCLPVVHNHELSNRMLVKFDISNGRRLYGDVGAQLPLRRHFADCSYSIGCRMQPHSINAKNYGETSDYYISYFQSVEQVSNILKKILLFSFGFFSPIFLGLWFAGKFVVAAERRVGFIRYIYFLIGGCFLFCGLVGTIVALSLMGMVGDGRLR